MNTPFSQYLMPARALFGVVKFHPDWRVSGFTETPKTYIAPQWVTRPWLTRSTPAPIQSSCES